MRPGPRPLLLALLLGSCYNPDYVGAHFQCDPQQACPSGLNCVQGYCMAGDGGDADGSMAAMPDLSAGRAPDLAGPPPPSGGCKGPGGIQVGPDIYACPGLFPAGQAKDLCRDGYDICADGQMVNAAACGNQGFFATRTQAHRYLIDDPTSSRC